MLAPRASRGGFFANTLALRGTNGVFSGTLDVAGVGTFPAGIVANVTGDTTGTHNGSVAGGVTGAFSGAVTVGTINGYQLLTGSADPSAGGGVAATQPALYMRTGTDQIWLNNGAGDTAWTRLATGVDTALLAPLASPTFTGTVSGSSANFSSTVTAQGALLALGQVQFFAAAAQNITAVGQALTVGAMYKKITANGTYTLTSAPQIAAPVGVGVMQVISFSGSGGVTFTDETGVPGSLLQLAAATRALVDGSVLGLVFDGTYWQEMFWRAS